MRHPSISLFGIAAGIALVAQASAGCALEAAHSKPVAGPPDEQNSQSVIAKYCLSNANALADAHLAWQRDRLAQMEDELKQKIAELEAKQAEYKKWVIARQELLAKGEEGVVAIFSHMRPDAAALQLSAMQDDSAAAVLSKLNPRNASAILNEIDPARAARLTDVMAGITKKTSEAKNSP